MSQLYRPSILKTFQTPMKYFNPPKKFQLLQRNLNSFKKILTPRSEKISTPPEKSQPPWKYLNPIRKKSQPQSKKISTPPVKKLNPSRIYLNSPWNFTTALKKSQPFRKKLKTSLWSFSTPTKDFSPPPPPPRKYLIPRRAKLGQIQGGLQRAI